MKKPIFAAALGALVLIPIASDAAPELEPGLWEIIVKTSGAMGMGSGTHTTKECIKAEDLVKPEDFTPDLVMPEMQCVKKNFTESGNTLTWEVACTGYGMNMEGTGTYVSQSPQAYEGIVKMRVKLEGLEQLGGIAMNTTTTYSGQRIGPCAQ